MSQYLSPLRQSPDELYHHGIKGQRKGVRRFQYPDGTLTPAGKKRYGSWDTRKATWKQQARLYNDATKGQIKSDIIKRKYDSRLASMDKSSRKYEKTLAKSNEASESSKSNYDARVKIAKSMGNNKDHLSISKHPKYTSAFGANGYDVIAEYKPMKGKSDHTLIRKTNPDGSLTDHGKKSLQRLERKFEKNSAKADAYEASKLNNMQDAYKAFRKKTAEKKFAAADDDLRKQTRYMQRGVKALSKMQHKYSDAYIDTQYTAIGKTYTEKLGDIYNQRIITGRK